MQSLRGVPPGGARESGPKSDRTVARKLFDTRVYVYVDFTLRGTIDGGTISVGVGASFVRRSVLRANDSILERGHRFLGVFFFFQKISSVLCTGSRDQRDSEERCTMKRFDAFFPSS